MHHWKIPSLITCSPISSTTYHQYYLQMEARYTVFCTPHPWKIIHNILLCFYGLSVKMTFKLLWFRHSLKGQQLLPPDSLMWGEKQSFAVSYTSCSVVHVFWVVQNDNEFNEHLFSYQNVYWTHSNFKYCQFQIKFHELLQDRMVIAKAKCMWSTSTQKSI